MNGNRVHQPRGDLKTLQAIYRGDGLRQEGVDLIQDVAVAYTCRKNVSAFALPAGAFYKIADFKIESAFEPIFLGQIIHCNHFNR